MRFGMGLNGREVIGQLLEYMLVESRHSVCVQLVCRLGFSSRTHPLTSYYYHSQLRIFVVASALGMYTVLLMCSRVANGQCIELQHK